MLLLVVIASITTKECKCETKMQLFNSGLLLPLLSLIPIKIVSTHVCINVTIGKVHFHVFIYLQETLTRQLGMWGGEADNSVPIERENWDKGPSNTSLSQFLRKKHQEHLVFKADIHFLLQTKFLLSMIFSFIQQIFIPQLYTSQLYCLSLLGKPTENVDFSFFSVILSQPWSKVSISWSFPWRNPRKNKHSYKLS